MSAKTIFIIILTILITIVMMQNTDEVKFKVLLWDLYLPKLVILTGVIFIGIVIGLMLSSRPSRAANSNLQDYNDDDDEHPRRDTLSAEDRDYIS